MSSLEQKIDALAAQMAQMAEQQRKRDELFEEMTPILKEVMAVGSERLSGLEERGYFEFGRSLLHVVDNVVQGYSAQDVEALASSVVGILDTVRSMTQPHMLKMAAEMGEVVEGADDVKPVGVMGTIRAASKDEEVQRGMAVMLEVLRHLGHGAQKMNRREKLRRQLASRRPSQAPAAALPAPRPARTAPGLSVEAKAASAGMASARPAVLVPQIDGVVFTDEGFMQDSAQWTREVGTAIAAGLGVGPLTESHWTLIEFARAEFGETGASPNIRRLSKGSGVGTKEIYGLFPKTPGKYTAMIAGLPKPVGCI